ncbi:hypothetical protein JCM10450v2_002515 [Rhodotorula kratochvilovae]
MDDDAGNNGIDAFNLAPSSHSAAASPVASGSGSYHSTTQTPAAQNETPKKRSPGQVERAPPKSPPAKRVKREGSGDDERGGGNCEEGLIKDEEGAGEEEPVVGEVAADLRRSTRRRRSKTPAPGFAADEDEKKPLVGAELRKFKKQQAAWDAYQPTPRPYACNVFAPDTLDDEHLRLATRQQPENVVLLKAEAPFSMKEAGRIQGAVHLHTADGRKKYGTLSYSTYASKNIGITAPGEPFVWVGSADHWANRRAFDGKLTLIANAGKHLWKCFGEYQMEWGGTPEDGEFAGIGDARKREVVDLLDGFNTDSIAFAEFMFGECTITDDSRKPLAGETSAAKRKARIRELLERNDPSLKIFYIILRWVGVPEQELHDMRKRANRPGKLPFVKRPLLIPDAAEAKPKVKGGDGDEGEHAREEDDAGLAVKAE